MNALEAIQAAHHKRTKRYEHHFVDVLNPERRLPFVVGSYSCTYLFHHRRDLLVPCCVQIGDGEIESPSAVARDYLTWRYKRGPIFKISQDVVLADYHMPMFATPQCFPYGEYIDVKSAWWSILSVVGWDTDLWPGRWWRFGRPCTDWPFPKEKRARNCLVSVGLVRETRTWSPQEQRIVRKKSFNRLYNRSVYAAMSIVLSSIAQECIAAGAVYWHTDGGIAPSAKIAEAMEDIILRWGLTPTVKASGAGYVASIGHYTFGERWRGCEGQKMKPLYRDRATKKTINPVDGAWVFERWNQALARQAIRNQGLE